MTPSAKTTRPPIRSFDSIRRPFLAIHRNVFHRSQAADDRQRLGGGTPAVCCLLSAACYLLPAARCLLPAVCCLLPYDAHALDTRENQQTLLMAALLAVAAALRLSLNNIVQYSPADESIYLEFAKMLTGGERYADVIRTYVSDQDFWLFPSPLRWSFIGAASLACKLAGQCSHRVIATVSTIAGILSAGFTWQLGRDLFGRTTALVAAALVATSPLQLALGRRALADEFFGMLVLASLVALVRYLRTDSPAWLAAWIAATTLTFGAKEQFLLIYPVILAFWLLQKRRFQWRDFIAWGLPPFLYFAVFCLLARDVTSFFRIAHLTTSTIGAEYPEQYQNGPAQRLLIDFMAVAPIVTMLAIAAAGWIATQWRERTREQQNIFVLFAGIMLLHSLLSSKNLRYVISADSPARLLVSTFLCTTMNDRRWLTLLLIANAVVELLLFRTIFLQGNVYDPITDDLLRALKMLPR